MMEEETMNDLLANLHDYVTQLIKSNRIKELKNKQKLYAIASFLNFIYNGANIKLLPIKNNEAIFVLKMK